MIETILLTVLIIMLSFVWSLIGMIALLYMCPKKEDARKLENLSVYKQTVIAIMLGPWAWIFAIYWFIKYIINKLF